MSKIESIQDKYPELFSGNNRSETSVSLFGVECGPGWYDILDRLCGELIGMAKNDGLQLPCVLQIKEKFGTLRFYIDRGSEEMDARIHKAEVESSTVCELCGEPGERTIIDGWFSTVCQRHVVELSNKKL